MESDYYFKCERRDLNMHVDRCLSDFVDAHCGGGTPTPKACHRCRLGAKHRLWATIGREPSQSEVARAALYYTRDLRRTDEVNYHWLRDLAGLSGVDRPAVGRSECDI